MPVEADRVAHATGENLAAGTIGVHAQDAGKRRFGFADVAGRTDRHIEFSVRAEGDEFPAVTRIVGQGVSHHHGCGWAIQLPVDVVETQDAIDGRHVEVAVLPCHTYRHLQAIGDDRDALGAHGRIDAHGMHLAGAHRADIHRTALCVEPAKRHLPRIVDLRPVFDAEPRRQADVFQWQGGGGCRQAAENKSSSGTNKHRHLRTKVGIIAFV